MVSTILSFLRPILRTINNFKDLSTVLLIVAILAIIIVPLPSVVLDFLLTISLASSVLIIMIAMYIEKPTDFTTFPTLLLLITIFRLSINIATTRMILSEGHKGPENVSEIVTSFGNFVVGGNMVIGVIIFIILVLINFIVVTNGSTRVAEVTARFTLDAMPGRQMAIDADLNAGLIDDVQAKERRAAILQEADFYGSMDGSSKFVKGDAIAGIIITIINIIGGFMIGVFMHGMEFAESAQTYTILTIGDGLVSQIPALIISTAVGIITTRASSDGGNFADNSIKQLVGEYKSLIIVGFILLMFSLIPGLPGFSLSFIAFIFLFLGGLIKLEQDGKLGDILGKSKNKSSSDKSVPNANSSGLAQQPNEQIEPRSPEEIRKNEEDALSDILKIEVLELDLGYQLIRLADSSQGGDLLDRIRGMRRKIAESYGFIMPQVRIRDNLQLLPSNYKILLKGVEVGKGEIQPEKLLAMNSGMTTEELEGDCVKEPAFGIDAVWITIDKKDDAIVAGYTVVDPSTVLSTHMSELVKKYASELLTRQEVQYLLDKLKDSYPIIVEDAIRIAGVGLIQQILKALLYEKIPINDMVTILETITETAEITKSADIITEQVRARLSRVITNMFKTTDNKLQLLTLSPEATQHIMSKLNDSPNDSTLLLNANEINILIENSTKHIQEALQSGITPIILIVDPALRKPLSSIFSKFNMQVTILSHAEIDNSVDFEVISTIEIPFE